MTKQRIEINQSGSLENVGFVLMEFPKEGALGKASIKVIFTALATFIILLLFKLRVLFIEE